MQNKSEWKVLVTLRKAKIVHNFGLSECNRVKRNLCTFIADCLFNPWNFVFISSYHQVTKVYTEVGVISFFESVYLNGDFRFTSLS